MQKISYRNIHQGLFIKDSQFVTIWRNKAAFLKSFNTRMVLSFVIAAISALFSGVLP
jgi:hypothetical protein